MGGDAVELVVRFAQTLLAVTRIARGGRFVIGTAPGVDLPVAGVTAFPLVDAGFVVRLPVGVAATAGGVPVADREIVLARGARIDVTLGAVTVAIARVDDVPVALPRPREPRRIVPFALAALAVHVAIVATAMATAAVEPVTIPVVRAEPPRIVPTKTLPVKPPKPKRPRRATAAAGGGAATATDAGGTPAQRLERATEAARHAGFLDGLRAEDLARIVGTKNLAKELADVGPLYDEEAANAQNFGNSAGKFDPSKDPTFDSVKTGRYATVGGGRGAGANYRLPAHGKFREVEPPPIMGLTCDDGSCTTVGSLDRFTVRDHVEKRYVDMVTCFERHARGARRIELTLRFDIGRDGRPAEVHANAASGFGSCVARIVERVKFPADRPTQVTYPIAFWRT